MKEGVAQLTREVAGHLFVTNVRAPMCATCGEGQVTAAVLQQFDLHVASKLADAGDARGESFRFMRKALGLQGNAFAEMLGVAPETVSRWEGDKRAANRSAVAILCAMVREATENRTTTLDSLRRLQTPRPLDARIDLQLPDPVSRPRS